MRSLKLTIAYDGTNYVGWQVQTNGVSVQQRLEEAWTQITGEKIRITASGRTDSGVHALAQICGLKTNSDIPCDRLPFALTSQTPEDISVLKAEPAPDDFDPIRHCTSKTYRYTVQSGSILDVHGRGYRWHVPQRLDVEAMEKAAAFIRGERDFKSFEAKGAERLTTVRNVTCLEIIHRRDEKHDFDYFDFVVTSNGFLYNMVRNIVGTIIDVGAGRKPPEWVQWVLEQKDRNCAGQTAPACGLVLVEVSYRDQNGS
ncbi:MAG: tRNA pseudouridine(38-40) synthase TruA [Planctomycetota bacterium]